MMGDSKLLPCPFCGGEVETGFTALRMPFEPLSFRCKSCGARVSFDEPVCNHGMEHGDDTPARLAWNRRAERTCRMVHESAERGLVHIWVCSECGGINVTLFEDAPAYCGVCKAKVVE